MNGNTVLCQQEKVETMSKFGMHVWKEGRMYFHPCEYNIEVILRQMSEYVETLKDQKGASKLRVEAQEHVPGEYKQKSKEASKVLDTESKK